MPSTFKFSGENIERLRTLKKLADLNDSSVIEFRDKSWWSKASLIELEKLKYTVCSVDAPLLPKRILYFSGIYLRLHGSKSWYNYLYSEKELKNIIKRLQKSSESKKSILLNNDHGMLPNGKFLMEKMLRKA